MKQSQEFGYIHHTVAFSLKWDKGSQQEKDFLEKSYDILILVPNVENFAIRKQISKKNDFDYELTMDFESEEKYEEYKDLCNKVMIWTLDNMQDEEGYFYYQKKKYFTSKIPYMRWSQAFMMNAMSYYLLNNNKGLES